jgi:hypothetical protein
MTGSRAADAWAGPRLRKASHAADQPNSEREAEGGEADPEHQKLIRSELAETHQPELREAGNHSDQKARQVDDRPV